MIFLAADAFNNPDSPVYYIVGSIFLLLVFGLLAAYLILSKRFEKKKRSLDNEKSENNDCSVADENNETINIPAEQGDTVSETEENTKTETSDEK